MIKKIMTLLVLIFLLTGFSYANEPEVDLTKIESLANSLQEENYLPDISFSNLVKNYRSSGKIGLSPKDFVKVSMDFIFKEIVSNSKLMIQLLILGLLSAILENIQNSFGDTSVSKIAYYSCFLIMVIIIIKSFTLAVGIAQTTINNMIEFTMALTPLILGIMASTGAFVTSAIMDPIIMFLIRIVSDVIRGFVLPVTTLALIVKIVDNLSDEIKITKLGSLIGQINAWTIGFIMTAFIGFTTVRAGTAATLDQVTLKSAKFAIDNFIPVVGKCLSDAISTVAGYSIVLKDAISVVGLIYIVFMCIFPLIKIIVISLIYKFVGAVMEPIVDKKIVSCLNIAGNSLVMVFASILCVAIMFFIMISIMASYGKLII